MKTVSVALKNGFNYSQSVFSVNSDAKISRVYYSGECTWTDNEPVNGHVAIEIPENAVALVRAGCNSQIGWGDPELVWGEFPPLQLPHGKILWFKEWGQHTLQPVQVLTIKDYIAAQIVDEIREFNSLEWVEMPYEWGHQAAACYWRLNNGELQIECGTGDQTPYLKPDGSFSSLAEDRENELIEFDKACEDGEKFQGGAVFSHLKYSFQFKNNPLPSLRKRFGGEWKYFDFTKEPFENWIDSGKPMIFLGAGWFVTYKA